MAATHHQGRGGLGLEGDRLGMRMTKRAMIIAGSGSRSRSRAPPTTPVPSWKVFNNQLYDGMNKPPPASARKLAASLWELQEFPLPVCFSACLLHHHNSPRHSHSPTPTHSHSHATTQHQDPAAGTASSPENDVAQHGFLSAAPNKTGHRRGTMLQSQTGSSRSHEHEAAHLQKPLSRSNMESGGMVERQRHRPCALFATTRNSKPDADASQQTSITATMSQELLKVFSQIRVLEQQHNSSLTLTTALHTELLQAHARIRDLELLLNRTNAHHQIETLLKKHSEEKTLWKSQEKAKLQSLTSQLEEERTVRLRIEHASRQLTKELVEAQSAAATAAQELEKERKARELIEEVCHELAQETGEEKAEVAEMKRESQKVREELEEERRMLQLAEVWREERVQMKLGEAKLALEEKTAALDVMRGELESFLRTQQDGAGERPRDGAMFRDAHVLQNVIDAISDFPAGEYVNVAADAEAEAGGEPPLYFAEGIPDAD